MGIFVGAKVATFASRRSGVRQDIHITKLETIEGAPQGKLPLMFFAKTLAKTRQGDTLVLWDASQKKAVLAWTDEIMGADGSFVLADGVSLIAAFRNTAAGDVDFLPTHHSQFHRQSEIERDPKLRDAFATYEKRMAAMEAVQRRGAAQLIAEKTMCAPMPSPPKPLGDMLRPATAEEMAPVYAEAYTATQSVALSTLDHLLEEMASLGFGAELGHVGPDERNAGDRWVGALFQLVENVKATAKQRAREQQAALMREHALSPLSDTELQEDLRRIDTVSRRMAEAELSRHLRAFSIPDGSIKENMGALFAARSPRDLDRGPFVGWHYYGRREFKLHSDTRAQVALPYDPKLGGAPLFALQALVPAVSVLTTRPDIFARVKNSEARFAYDSTRYQSQEAFKKTALAGAKMVAILAATTAASLVAGPGAGAAVALSLSFGSAAHDIVETHTHKDRIDARARAGLAGPAAQEQAALAQQLAWTTVLPGALAAGVGGALAARIAELLHDSFGARLLLQAILDAPLNALAGAAGVELSPLAREHDAGGELVAHAMIDGAAFGALGGALGVSLHAAVPVLISFVRGDAHVSAPVRIVTGDGRAIDGRVIGTKAEGLVIEAGGVETTIAKRQLARLPDEAQLSQIEQRVTALAEAPPTSLRGRWTQTSKRMMETLPPPSELRTLSAQQLLDLYVALTTAYAAYPFETVLAARPAAYLLDMEPFLLAALKRAVAAGEWVVSAGGDDARIVVTPREIMKILEKGVGIMSGKDIAPELDVLCRYLEEHDPGWTRPVSFPMPKSIYDHDAPAATPPREAQPTSAQTPKAPPPPAVAPRPAEEGASLPVDVLHSLLAQHGGARKLIEELKRLTRGLVSPQARVAEAHELATLQSLDAFVREAIEKEGASVEALHEVESCLASLPADTPMPALRALVADMPHQISGMSVDPERVRSLIFGDGASASVTLSDFLSEGLPLSAALIAERLRKLLRLFDYYAKRVPHDHADLEGIASAIKKADVALGERLATDTLDTHLIEDLSVDPLAKVFAPGTLKALPVQAH